MLNFALIHPTKVSDKDKDSAQWDHPATIPDVLECLDGFDPKWVDMAKMIDEVKLFKVMHHQPLERISRGKACLVGDAAHSMLPTHGQGAAMAIEDAAALEAIFTGCARGREDIEKYLEAFQKARLARDATVQILSNYWFAPWEDMMKRIEPYGLAGTIPEKGTMDYSKKYRDWLFRYDVYGEAEKALKDTLKK